MKIIYMCILSSSFLALFAFSCGVFEKDSSEAGNEDASTTQESDTSNPGDSELDPTNDEGSNSEEEIATTVTGGDYGASWIKKTLQGPSIRLSSGLLAAVNLDSGFALINSSHQSANEDFFDGFFLNATTLTVKEIPDHNFKINFYPHYTIANKKLFLWSGTNSIEGDGLEGGLYDFGTKGWKKISNTGAPSPRSSGATAFNGTEVLVWQGYHGKQEMDGALYNPSTDSWRSISTENAPQVGWSIGRLSVAMGSKFVVMVDKLSGFNTQAGGIYDPNKDEWTPIPQVDKSFYYLNVRHVWKRGEEVVVFASTLSRDRNYGFLRLDTNTLSWKELMPPLSLAEMNKSSISETVFTGDQFVFAKRIDDDSHDFYVYDFNKEQWFTLPALKVGPLKLLSSGFKVFALIKDSQDLYEIDLNKD